MMVILLAENSGLRQHFDFPVVEGKQINYSKFWKLPNAFIHTSTGYQVQVGQGRIGDVGLILHKVRRQGMFDA
jgi:hypothetical protein